MINVKPFTDLMLLALCVWREASGEPVEAKQAIAWSIKNRVLHPSWYGKDWADVVTKPVQYTSMVPPKGMLDPNLLRYPQPADPSWADTLKVASDVMDGVIPDPTGGATFYFDKSMDAKPPAWAKLYTHTADIGTIHFYKPV